MILQNVNTNNKHRHKNLQNNVSKINNSTKNSICTQVHIKGLIISVVTCIT